MNTKKKNKNKNKPTPPNPVQRDEVVKRSDTNIEEKFEIQGKSEERVPEILCEVNPMESRVLEIESPKKPKRNRGTKNKSDKDENEDIVEHNVECVTDKTASDMVEKNLEETQAKIPDVLVVTPVARKKKNKNKKQNEFEKKDDLELAIVKDEIVSDLQDNLLTVPEGFEEVKGKKKNKKKKRLDSEKSEKAEEIISCTAAFQKLLEPRIDKKDEPKTELPSESAQESKEVNITNIKQTEPKEENIGDRTETPTDEGKRKKKNKKDKKQPLRIPSETERLQESETKATKAPILADEKRESSKKDETAIVVSGPDILEKENSLIQPAIEKDKPKAEEVKNILLDTQIHKPDTHMITDIVTMTPDQSLKNLEKEKSPKPKAKIAKPVEKKRKSDERVSDDPNVGIDIVKEIKEEAVPIESAGSIEVSKTDRNKDESIGEKAIEREKVLPVPKIDERQLETQASKICKSNEEVQANKQVEEEQIDVPQKTEQLNISEEKGRKKCKKSLKPELIRHQDETKKETNVMKSTEEKKEAFETSLVPKTMVTELGILGDIVSQTAKVKENICTAEAKKEEETISTKQVIENLPDVSQKPEQMKVPEEKGRKKCKKSPKPDEPELPSQMGKESHLAMKTKSENKDVPEKSTTAAESKVMRSPTVLPQAIKAEATSTAKSFEDVMEYNKDANVETAPSKEETNQSFLTLYDEPATAAKSLIDSLFNVPRESFIVSPGAVPNPELVLTQKEGKKGKKSAKSKKNDELEKCDIKVEKKKAVSPVEEITEDESLEKEKSEMLDLPQLEDIEIKSVKTEESDSSICDLVPDIDYPRATSLDNNNNMTIQDVTSISEGKFNVPIVIPDTPLIKGSGESPTPGITSTGIVITEIKQSSPEKTDLKSKVIEVNKDMEDLRLSIERSLAELTALEKSEEQTEKKLEDAHAKIEMIKNLATKPDTVKVSEVTQTEKALDPPTLEMTDNLVSKVEHKESIEKKDDTRIKSLEVREETASSEIRIESPIPPTPPPPPRKDNKGKNKKKKGKQDIEHGSSSQTTTSNITTMESSCKESTTTDKNSEDNKEDSSKSDQKPESKQEKGKQQSIIVDANESTESTKTDGSAAKDFEPIDNFEDALTSNDNTDDVNKTFEMIAKESSLDNQNNPEINVTAPIEDDEKQEESVKVNPVSQPKNLLGHPDIPARLNRTDYKKEKNKTPNTRQAKVNIKDSVPIEVNKESKVTQTENKRKLLKDKTVIETVSSLINDNEEYIYKYSFRRVFLPNACHTCKKDLKFGRSPCNFCNLVFYCGAKHRDEDYPHHQALCFAVSTIAHLKDQKHLYADAKSITGQDYRLLRMQMIVSCEKVLKRRLVPWEQEALLYPRICADVDCREWRQAKLEDCEGCGQISYCSDNPAHLPKTHQRYCKSYLLYQKLVTYQQTKGRLEPRLPARVMTKEYQIPEKMNEILATMYEERIDMNDIQYAALTQIATAPLTAAYSHQLYVGNSGPANGVSKKSTFTIHVVGAELQFEADALNKWEVFFLHLRPDVVELRVVLIGMDLNPSHLPLDLLAKIKLCDSCRQQGRRVTFDFQDKKTYYDYWSSDFVTPELVCAFNPSIQRSSIYNGKDVWPSTIQCIVKQKVPFVVTAYTLMELDNDVARILECSKDVQIISEPRYNPFASVRPDRNFISDDEIPLLFKNFCFTVLCG